MRDKRRMIIIIIITQKIQICTLMPEEGVNGRSANSTKQLLGQDTHISSWTPRNLQPQKISPWFGDECDEQT